MLADKDIAPEQPVSGQILLVDDTVENLQLLSALLEERGYEVRCAISGTMALIGTEADPPDLILLDINMPELDGYTVCQKLKAQAQTCEIPVIFLSVLDDGISLLKAFEVGGVELHH